MTPMEQTGLLSSNVTRTQQLEHNKSILGTPTQKKNLQELNVVQQSSYFSRNSGQGAVKT